MTSFKEKLNQILLGDCVKTMESFPDECIDLTITSPPYDELRTYNGYCFDFENVSKQLYRITKTGGVVIWNVNDAVENNSESLTSFKQAIHFVEKCGFYLHDTMIWFKPNPLNWGYEKANRFLQSFEYMFVFSKGKPKTFHPLTERSKTAGQLYTSVKVMSKDGKPIRETIPAKAKNERKLLSNVWNVESEEVSNVWSIATASLKGNHPAIFPEALPELHIQVWSSEGEIIFDPFMGSGTTALAAMKNNRKYIGCEISQEYLDDANKRIESEMSKWNSQEAKEKRAPADQSVLDLILGS